MLKDGDCHESHIRVAIENFQLGRMQLHSLLRTFAGCPGTRRFEGAANWYGSMYFFGNHHLNIHLRLKADNGRVSK